MYFESFLKIPGEWHRLQPGAIEGKTSGRNSCISFRRGTFGRHSTLTPHTDQQLITYVNFCPVVGNVPPVERNENEVLNLRGARCAFWPRCDHLIESEGCLHRVSTATAAACALQRTDSHSLVRHRQHKHPPKSSLLQHLEHATAFN